MNRNLSIGVAAVAAMALAGCSDKPVLTVNGQAITKDQYIKLLERTTIQQPGGQPTKAERLVVDTIISNQVILSEAGKAGLLPSETDVNNFFGIQKKLMENQQPDKKYDEELAKQGMTADEVKEDLKVQMAETNLYARKLDLGDKEVRAEYDKNRDKIGLPARTQLRLIVLQPNTPDVQQATKMLADGKAFEEVAKVVNDPQLKATGGEQVVANQQLPPAIQTQVDKLKDGEKVGPIDWVIPAAPGQPARPALKAWIKVIKHMPAFNLSYEDASPILKRDLVRQKILDPANASKRDEVLKVKMDANLQSDDAQRMMVWADIKKIAKDMGVGAQKAADSSAPAQATPAPAGGAAPKTK